VIRGERSGKFIWYALEGAALVEAEHWLRELVDLWAASPTLSKELGRAAAPPDPPA